MISFVALLSQSNKYPSLDWIRKNSKRYLPWGVNNAEKIEQDLFTFSISLVIMFCRKFLVSSPVIEINPRSSNKIIWSFSINAGYIV